MGVVSAQLPNPYLDANLAVAYGLEVLLESTAGLLNITNPNVRTESKILTN